MDGVGTPIIGRPRPLPGHDTPNPAYHPHTLNYEEPVNSHKLALVEAAFKLASFHRNICHTKNLFAPLKLPSSRR